ncbi:MAG TPA: methyltransferase domain-containing protein [Burkholderiaceae bacterium]|nr:methyltransferase domain-containing protein [Burkholderiaceae bacterium]
MSNEAGTHAEGVIGFYDRHPINEDEILAKLAARGVALDTLTEEQLKDFDQDHYGGVDVVEALAERAGIAAGHHVLDVCSGMGGPARWIAHRYGCRVTGLDFTASRVEAARRLTRRVGLEERVDFEHGDATAMPLPDARFDVVISQEAWLHIPDKQAVIRECARVVRPSGVIAFTDVIARAPLAADEAGRLAREMHAPRVADQELYPRLLREHGCIVESVEDLSRQWAEVLVARLAMYRSLRDTTVAKFGDAHFDAWDRTYAFFVGLFVAGRLGGTRIVARRAAA